MKKLYLLFLTLLCALPGLAQEMYLVPAGETQASGYKFTFAAGTYTLSLNELSGSFQIWYLDEDNEWYKMASSSTLQLGTPFYITGGMENSQQINVGEYSISNAVITIPSPDWDDNLEGYYVNMRVSGKLNEPLPEEMYVYSATLLATQASQMTKVGTGVFTIENVSLPEFATYAPNAGFKFSNKKSSKGAITYGSAATDPAANPVELFKPTSVKQKGDAFCIAPGTYNIKLDLNTNTVLVEPVINSMNIVGSMVVNGTIGTSNISMTKDANGNFTASNVIIAGSGNANGTFYFAETYDNENSAPSGLQFGAANRNEQAVQPGMAKAITMGGQLDYTIATGIYNITLNMETMQVTLTPVNDASILVMTANSANYINTNPGDVTKFVVRAGDNFYGCATSQTVGMPLDLTPLGKTIDYITMTQGGAAVSMADRVLYFRTSDSKFVAVPKALKIIGKDGFRDMEFTDNYTFKGTVPYFDAMVLGAAANGAVYGKPATPGTGLYTLNLQEFSDDSWITDMTPFQNKIVEFNPYTRALTIAGDGNERPTVSTLNIVGTVVVNGEFTNGGIEMTKAEDSNVFTAENVILGGVNAPGNGTFFFAETYENGAASGFEFGAEKSNTNVTVGTAQNLAMTTNTFSVPQGIYTVTADMTNNKVTLTKADGTILEMTANGANYINTNPGTVNKFVIRAGNKLYGCADAQPVGMQFALTQLGETINYINMTQGDAAASLANRVLYFRPADNKFVAVSKSLVISDKAGNAREMTFTDSYTFRGTVPYFSEMVLGTAATGEVVYGDPVTLSSGVYTLTSSVFGESSWITDMTPFQNKIVEFNPFTMGLSIVGDGNEKPTVSTLNLVGTVVVNGAFTNGGIEMTKGEGNVFTVENVILGGVNASGNGTFYFAEKFENGAASGFDFGAEKNNTNVTVGTAQNVAMTTNTFSVPQGIYTVTVDMTNYKVTLTKADGTILDMTASGSNYINTNPGTVGQFVMRAGNKVYGCAEAQTVGMQFALTQLGESISYINMTQNGEAASLADRVLYFRPSNNMFVAVPKTLLISNKAGAYRTMEFTDNYTFKGTVPYFDEMVIGSEANGVVYGNPVTLSAGVYTLTPSVYGDDSFITDMKPFQNKIVEFNPFTMALNIVGDGNEKPTISTLTMVGTLGINGELSALTSTNGIAMTAGENGTFTAKNVIISGNGNFFFVQKTGADWDHAGFQYGPRYNDTKVTVGEAQALTMTTSQAVYNVAQGIYDVTVDMENMTVLLTATDGTILEMTANGSTYVNNEPGNVNNFIVRAGNQFFGYNGQIQVGMPATLAKLGESVNYVQMMQGDAAANTENRRFFFNAQNGTFIAVPTTLTMVGNNNATVEMDYNAQNGTYTATVPYWTSMVIGNVASDNAVYGAPVTAGANNVYTLKASTTAAPITGDDMLRFQNKVVAFNPLAMTLAITGNGNVKPEIEALYYNGGTTTMKFNGSGNEFSANIQLTQNSTFTLTDASGNAYAIALIPTGTGDVDAGQTVSMDYSTVHPAKGFTFVGESGIYKMTVNLTSMTVFVAATAQKTVTNFADLRTNEGGYFTGTATCVFNYENDQNTYNMWLEDADGTALEFLVNPANITGFDVDYVGPTHFNRGNTISRFRATLVDGVYVITQFDLQEVPQGSGKVPLPYIGKAQESALNIKVVEDVTEDMLNQMVQIKGQVWFTSDRKEIIVGNNTIPIINDFKRPLDVPMDAPRRAQGESTGWQYGQDIPSYEGNELYVSGIVTKDAAGNVGINVTSISSDVITGVETVELDEESIVDVYTMQGVVVRRAVKYGEVVRELPSGMYIIGGKKMMIRN